MKHTEGPWKALINSDLVEEIYVYPIHGKENKPICVLERGQEADARLIACAPAMELALANAFMAVQNPSDIENYYKAFKNVQKVLKECGYFAESDKELEEFMKGNKE